MIWFMICETRSCFIIHKRNQLIFKMQLLVLWSCGHDFGIDIAFQKNLFAQIISKLFKYTASRKKIFYLAFGNNMFHNFQQDI